MGKSMDPTASASLCKNAIKIMPQFYGDKYDIGSVLNDHRQSYLQGQDSEPNRVKKWGDVKLP